MEAFWHSKKKVFISILYIWGNDDTRNTIAIWLAKLNDKLMKWYIINTYIDEF